MKKSMLITCFLIINVLFSLNCFAAGEYTLRYNLKKGDVFKQTMPMDMQISMNAMGQNIDMNIQMEFAATVTVVVAEGDIYTLECNYTRFKTATNNSFMKMIIDTDNPELGGELAEVSRILKSIIDVPLTVKMDKFGKIVAVSGFDKLLKTVIDVAEKSGNPMSKQIAESTLQQNFSEASLKESFEQNQIVYPAEPIKIGDSWDAVQTKVVQGVEMQINVKQTLKSVSDNLATIESLAVIEGKEATVETPQGNVTYSMKGTYVYTTKVGLKNGMAVSGDFSMEMDMKMNTQGMEMPMKMTVKGSLITN
jgi:hypothetical protein